MDYDHDKGATYDLKIKLPLDSVGFEIPQEELLRSDEHDGLSV